MVNYIKIGKTQKAHGIKGELKLNIEDHFIEDLLEVEAIFLEINGQKVPYFVEEIQDGNILLIKIEGIENRTSAEQLMHKDLYMRREDIHISDEEIASGAMLYKFLEGFMIVDVEIGEIGVIEEVAEFPQQEMAYITFNNQTKLVPLNEVLIMEIDRDNKNVIMNLPDGLLEI